VSWNSNLRRQYARSDFRNQTYSGFSKTSAFPDAALPSSLLSRLRMGPVNQWRAPRMGLYHLQDADTEELRSGSRFRARIKFIYLGKSKGFSDDQV